MVKVKIRITCNISKLSVSMVIIIYPADTEAALGGGPSSLAFDKCALYGLKPHCLHSASHLRW